MTIALVVTGGGTLAGVTDPSETSNGGDGGPVDHIYLKNVLLKFVVAATGGKIEQVRRSFLSGLQKSDHSPQFSVP